jgi:hypothetical protein
VPRPPAPRSSRRRADKSFASCGKSVLTAALARPYGLWHHARLDVCCRSSGVEHSLGKGEVESSNLSGSTIFALLWAFRPPADQLQAFAQQMPRALSSLCHVPLARPYVDFTSSTIVFEAERMRTTCGIERTKGGRQADLSGREADYRRTKADGLPERILKKAISYSRCAFCITLA